MKVKLYWPKCDFLNEQLDNECIDSYWVECTFDEAEKNVFPYLSSNQIDESKRNWEPKRIEDEDIKIETDLLCYLVSKDLHSIASFSWYYPYSGQWNAYCPFKEIKEIEINELNELTNIIIETE